MAIYECNINYNRHTKSDLISEINLVYSKLSRMNEQNSQLQQEKAELIEWLEEMYKEYQEPEPYSDDFGWRDCLEEVLNKIKGDEK